MKTTVTAADAPAAIGPYSQAVACGNLIFLSGQIGLDPASGELVTGGSETETEQVIRNLSAILATDNLTLDAIVRTTIYLVDLADFGRVNEIYGRHFHAPYPARATVGVAALPRGARVEIDAIAVRED